LDKTIKTITYNNPRQLERSFRSEQEQNFVHAWEIKHATTE
jgi:hypothetical protein